MPKSDSPNFPDTSESSTKVNIRLEGPRKPVSFRCNKKLWKLFVSEIKRDSLSTCHVLEPFLLAYLTSNVYVRNTSRFLIENFVVERAVKRVRRYEKLEEILETSCPESCFYCDNPPQWKCKTVFKINPIKFVCNHHMLFFDRKGEIISKESLDFLRKSENGGAEND